MPNLIKKMARYLKIHPLYRSDKTASIIRLEGIWIVNLGFKIGEVVKPLLFENVY